MAKKSAAAAVKKVDTVKDAPPPVLKLVEQLKDIPIKELKPGPFQYRRFFDEKKLEALAASIKRVGVQNRLIVRKATKGAGFEIIGGERRWRAAKMAGVAKVPCSVRVVDDEVGAELAVIDNSQREDPHPLEECDSFLELMKRWHRTPEQIAARIEKPIAYVYARLALKDLGEAGRKAWYNGVIGGGAARAFALIKDPKLQDVAVKDLTRHHDANEPLPAGRASEGVRRRFLLAIAKAPFDTTDATMPGGACGPCPKRSGNQLKLLTDDFGKDDMCLDPGCWEGKLAEFWKRTVAGAKEKGIRVLTPTETKELFPYSGSSMHSRTWIDLNGSSHETGSRTWGGVLGKDRMVTLSAIEGAVAYVRHADGSIFKVAQRAAVERVIRSAPKGNDPDALKPKKKGKKGKKEEAKPPTKAVAQRAMRIQLAHIIESPGGTEDLLITLIRESAPYVQLEQEIAELAKLLGLEPKHVEELVDPTGKDGDLETVLDNIGDVSRLVSMLFVLKHWHGRLDQLEEQGFKFNEQVLIEQAKRELADERKAKGKGKGKTEPEPKDAGDGEPFEKDDEE